MAVTGLQNVPILNSSIPRASRSSSFAPGHNENRGRAVSRTSSVLQMWKELEDECQASRARVGNGGRLQNESTDALGSSFLSSNAPQAEGTENVIENEHMNATDGEGSVGSQTEQDDHSSLTSEHSQDLGEAARERVRQIFREWMNSGGNGVTSTYSSLNSSPRAQLLGQSELGRVRAVREWIQTACELRDHCTGDREEQVTDIESQIQRVREGLVLDQNDGRNSDRRKDVRRLCGRQALLDLLANNKLERERELQGLLERHPVSSFTSRHRIQSLLRVRLLHNRSVENIRTTNSAAESELGVLRQRHTVSGLREGFLSRFDNSLHVKSNDQSGASSNKDVNGSRGNQNQPGSSSEAVGSDQEQLNPTDRDGRPGPSIRIENPLSRSDNSFRVKLSDHYGAPSNKDFSGSRGNQTQPNSSSVSVDNDQEQLNPPDRDSGPGSSNCIQSSLFSIKSSARGDTSSVGAIPLQDVDESRRQETMDNKASAIAAEGRAGQLQNVESSQAFAGYGEEELQNSSSSFHPDTAQSSYYVINDSEESNSGFEHIDHGQAEGTRGVISEQHDYVDYNDRQASPHPDGLHNRESDVEYATDPATRTYEQAVHNEDQESVGTGLPNEWTEGSQHELNEEEWQDDASGEQLLNDIPGNEDGFHHPEGNWSLLPSEPGVPSTRFDAYYDSDDDNAHIIELRELSSRRTVSSLLHSGFRESLDQLLQSYVERQGHAPDEWESDEMSSPPLPVYEEDMGNTNLNEDSSDLEGQSEDLQPTPSIPSQRNWEQEFHDIRWSIDMHQRPGTELEMINDLRNEMARLQQRMDNMQRMLLACMDMQLELQRSVRQEVSAALNRSINPTGPTADAITTAGSSWECVRKGVCCLCCESKIDSLLYRCGHMCTCAKCANALVGNSGKCPMCQAPVVEVVRAYTLQ